MAIVLSCYFTSLFFKKKLPLSCDSDYEQVQLSLLYIFPDVCHFARLGGTPLQKPISGRVNGVIVNVTRMRHLACYIWVAESGITCINVDAEFLQKPISWSPDENLLTHAPL